MKYRVGGFSAAVFFCALLQVSAPVLRGQDQAPALQVGRFSLGFRVRNFPFRPFSAMGDNRTMRTSADSGATYDWSYNTSAGTPGVSTGLASELPISQKMTLTLEVLYSGVRYSKTTDLYSGTDDPTTGTDERSHTSVSEDTRARLFDIPLMLHYRARKSGVLGKTFFSAGVTGRTVSKIATRTDISYANGNTDTLRVPVQPTRRNLLGGVVGIGFRFVDDFNVKVTPEVRFTRWAGGTFGSDSTRSPRNQIEVGIGFTL